MKASGRIWITASPTMAPQPREYSMFTSVMKNSGVMRVWMQTRKIEAIKPRPEMPMPTKIP